MFSLKPKEGGSANPPAPPRQTNQGNWMKVAIAVCVALIAGVGYSSYTTRLALEERITTLEAELHSKLNDEVTAVRNEAAEMASDLDVVTNRLGVTAKELSSARQFAERLREEQEAAKLALESELATKALSTDVAAVRAETTARVAEVAQDANSKFGNVSGEVKTVAANLDATRRDLAESRREIVDVRTSLSQQIARNASELEQLRAKGDRDFFEFDIRKGKKDVMQRVADIQLELRKTDQKKQRYDVIIAVDDSKLEKKERTANEPVQFLVGRDKLRYEIVVNFVDRDRIRGYLSTPKDKVLAAERPAFRE
jgi:chromosome segregation ATPase